MAQRTIYLVRHGEYRPTTGPAEEIDGGLTDTGRAQAELTARRLGQLPISVIYHSPLQRASETAAIIAARLPGVPLVSSDLLRECVPDVLAAELQPVALRDYFARLPAAVIERGRAQAAAAFDTYLAAEAEHDRHELIVSSGNLLRYFVCQVLHAPPGAWIFSDMNHCAISQIVIGPPHGRLLVCHSDSGHLPAHLLSYG